MKIGGIVALFNHTMHKVSTSIEYKEKLTQFLKDNGVNPNDKANQTTLDTYKIIFKEYWENSAQWIEFANAKTIKEWEDSTNKVSLNKDDTFSTAKGPAVGITNDRSGKVLLSTKLFKKTNWYLGYPIENDITEFRAYDEVRKWTGTLDPLGVRHLLNITTFFTNNFK